MKVPGVTHRRAAMDGRSTPGHPDLPLAQVAKAERRSAVDGPWSLEHLRLCWAALVSVAVIVSVIVALTVGREGLLGVIVGSAIVGAFFTVSAAVIAWVGARRPKSVLSVALVTYVIKIVILGVVIIALPRDGAISPRWMAIAVVIGLFTWLAAHLRFVLSAKVFYVDPRA